MHTPPLSPTFTARRSVEPMDFLYKVQEDGCRICPYNRSHVVQSLRFVYHLMKCSQTSGKSYEICPYNAQHHVVEPYHLEDHIGRCDNRDHAEALRYNLAIEAKAKKLAEEEKQKSAASNNTIQELAPVCDESNKKKPRVKPRYAIEAERLLREEYLAYEDQITEQPCQAEHNIRGPSSWGRGRALGFVPGGIPKPRPVPHQYTGSHRTPAILNDADLLLPQQQHSTQPNCTTQGGNLCEEDQPRKLTFLEECDGVQSSCSLAAAESPELNHVFENQSGADHCAADDSGKKNIASEELAVMKEFFYQTSLCSSPNVCAAFQGLVVTITREMSSLEKE